MFRLRAMSVIGGVLVAVAGLRMGLAQYLPITCPLRGLTGIPCASCGLTRGAVALCLGQLAAASAHNLAAIPLALALAAVLVLLAWEAITQRAILHPVLTRRKGVLTWSAVALVLAAWVVNLHRYFG